MFGIKQSLRRGYLRLGGAGLVGVGRVVGVVITSVERRTKMIVLRQKLNDNVNKVA